MCRSLFSFWGYQCSMSTIDKAAITPFNSIPYTSSQYPQLEIDCCGFSGICKYLWENFTQVISLFVIFLNKYLTKWLLSLFCFCCIAWFCLWVFFSAEMLVSATLFGVLQWSMLYIQPYVRAVGFFCASYCVLMLWAMFLLIGFLFTPVQKCWFQLLCWYCCSGLYQMM